MALSSPKLKPNLILNKYLWPIVISIVVVGAVLAVLFLGKPTPQPAQYSYSQLNSIKVASGSVGGSGGSVTFQKPVQDTVQTNTKGEALLVHYLPASKLQASYISAAVVDRVSPPISPELDIINRTMGDPSSKGYSSYTAPIQKFVTARLPSSAKTTFSSAKVFKNSHIKANAWQFDISSTISGSHRQQGEEVYAIANKAYYYFVLITPDYNWQSNQKVWNQVLDSIQVN